MINVTGLGISHGGEYLFNDVTFLINDRDRIGLVGRNGAGKSTILKILAKIRNADEGGISYPRECTVGYLQQDLSFTSGKSIFDETASALEEIKRLEARVHELTEKVTHTTDFSDDSYMDLLQELHDAQEHLHLLEAGSQEGKVEKILLGLGFDRNDFDKPVSAFSGGWQMRVELAKILLKQPTLLLLDEPTNHLDIESIQWLENFLQDYPGAILIVSHDKRFLDNLTNRTIEISRGKIDDYKAAYSRYIELRKERREKLMAAYQNQQNEIRQTEALIDKFRAKASKAKMAQSLIKQLDRKERIEMEDEDTSSIRFRFPEAPRSGVVVAEAKDLTKAYGEKVILKNLKFEVARNERVAFVGRNGEGKTTLAKIIKGGEPFVGDCTLGYNVKVGYYAQQQAEELDGNLTVFQTVERLADHNTRPKLRNLLGSFLFGGDDVDKKVKVLSGGEKSRLALACLLLEPANLLILDEPTNHLDMVSKEVLKEALQNYDGTLILVSHDRDFLQGLTNRTFYFRNQTIKEYIGDIEEFLGSLNLDSLQQLEIKQKQNAVDKQKSIDSPSDSEQKRNADKDKKKLENKLQKAEKTVEEYETAIAAIEKKMANPNEMKSANSQDIFSQYDELKKKLATATKEWEELAELVEKS